MKILVINSGSSSLKFKLIEMPIEEVLVEGIFDSIGSDKSFFKVKLLNLETKVNESFIDHKEAVKYLNEYLLNNEIIKNENEIAAIGHRVAHGGEKFKESVLIDQEVSEEIKNLISLAPLHNKANLDAYLILKDVYHYAKHIAVFDTSFHQSIKEENYIYPIHYDYYKINKIRKYGFHGTSYRYIYQRTLELLNESEREKMIICHLGNGASIACIKNGYVENTSMGFTPLGGIMMGTRSGDLDPSIIKYISEEKNMSISEVLNQLNKNSGMLGLSMYSSDAREVVNKAKDGDFNAKLCLEVYSRKIADYIGSYHVQLGGLNTLIFTAGIGENSAYIRELIIKKISEALLVVLDKSANENHLLKEKTISSNSSSVKVMVIPTDEEVVIARDSYEIMVELKFK